MRKILTTAFLMVALKANAQLDTTIFEDMYLYTDTGVYNGQRLHQYYRQVKTYNIHGVLVWYLQCYTAKYESYLMPAYEQQQPDFYNVNQYFNIVK